MGHKVGHVTLHAGIAGGADVILLPEIPYDIDVVTDVIQKRAAADKKFTIIAVAEGAISKEDARLKKKEYKEKLAKRKYPSIAYELAEKIQQKTDKEVRITVPGHTQRGGSPCAYDRVFATRVGAAAAELICAGCVCTAMAAGRMASVRGSRLSGLSTENGKTSRTATMPQSRTLNHLGALRRQRRRRSTASTSQLAQTLI